MVAIREAEMKVRFLILGLSAAFLFAYGEGTFAQEQSPPQQQNPFEGQSPPGSTGGAQQFNQNAYKLRHSPMAHKIRLTGQSSMLSHPAFGKQARQDCEADKEKFCSNIAWGKGVVRCLRGQTSLSDACTRRIAAVCKKQNQCPNEIIR